MLKLLLQKLHEYNACNTSTLILVKERNKNLPEVLRENKKGQSVQQPEATKI